MDGSPKKQWMDFKETLSGYFQEYGGFRAVWCSPFFRASLLIAILLVPLWASGKAPSLAIGIIPGLLGFSIAAFTLSLGVGSDRFRLLLAYDFGSGTSVVKEMANAFFHFVVLQISCLLLAILVGAGHVAFLLNLFDFSWDQIPISLRLVIVVVRALAGFFVSILLIYSLISALPAMLHVYKASKSFREFAQLRFRDEFKGGK